MTPEEQQKMIEESRRTQELARGNIQTFPQPDLDPKIAVMIEPRKPELERPISTRPQDWAQPARRYLFGDR